MIGGPARIILRHATGIGMAPALTPVLVLSPAPALALALAQDRALVLVPALTPALVLVPAPAPALARGLVRRAEKTRTAAG